MNTLNHGHKPTEMNNNKQQTAVEWLIKQLKLLELNKNRISEDAYKSRLSYMVNKAKEMEKEKAIKFACDVHINVKKDKVKSLMQLVDEKYNETYAGGEQ